MDTVTRECVFYVDFDRTFDILQVTSSGNFKVSEPAEVLVEDIFPGVSARFDDEGFPLCVIVFDVVKKFRNGEGAAMLVSKFPVLPWKDIFHALDENIPHARVLDEMPGNMSCESR